MTTLTQKDVTIALTDAREEGRDVLLDNIEVLTKALRDMKKKLEWYDERSTSVRDQMVILTSTLGAIANLNSQFRTDLMAKAHSELMLADAKLQMLYKMEAGQ